MKIGNTSGVPRPAYNAKQGEIRALLQRNLNHYQLLKLPRNASSSEIKATYRKMSLSYHPDKNPGIPEAKPLFQKVSQAYQNLSDPTQRAQYDRTLPPEHAPTVRKQDPVAPHAAQKHDTSHRNEQPPEGAQARYGDKGQHSPHAGKPDPSGSTPETTHSASGSEQKPFSPGPGSRRSDSDSDASVDRSFWSEWDYLYAGEPIPSYSS